MKGGDASVCRDISQEIDIIRHHTAFEAFRKVDIIDYREAGRDENRAVKREIVRAQNAVAILAYDPALEKLVFIHQFRIGAHLANGKGMSVEIVAGLIDNNETPQQTAIKELAEEAGLKAKRIEKLCTYLTSPGLTDETITLFYAEVDASTLASRAGLESETEETFPFSCTLEDALKAVDQNRISNGIAMFAILWFTRHMDTLIGSPA